MLRRAVRSAVVRFKEWLQEAPQRDNRDYKEEEFIYPELNALYLKIIKDGLRRTYAWGVLHGVNLAKTLGLQRVSVIEFGVAGGSGLIALEKIAERVEKIFELGVDVYGFDTGVGLPKPKDYRDLPNLYAEGYYPMHQEKLGQHLKKAKLILGPVEDTLPSFIASKPAPVAFFGCDLVLYTSTVHALRILDADGSLLLPRIHCYFDDILGFTFGDHNGERLAIAEFNASHSIRKLSQIYGLKYFVPSHCADDRWVEKFWLAHIFDHPLYGHQDNLVKRHTLDLKLQEI